MFICFKSTSLDDQGLPQRVFDDLDRLGFRYLADRAHNLPVVIVFTVQNIKMGKVEILQSLQVRPGQFRSFGQENLPSLLKRSFANNMPSFISSIAKYRMMHPYVSYMISL